jgi:hypothetical protein
MYEHTKQTCVAIGLTTNDFEESVWDTLIAYGADTIAEAMDIPKLRAFARIDAWKKVVLATSAKYDMSRDSGESPVYDKFNQLHTNAVKQLELAQAAAVEAGYVADGTTVNTLTVATVVHVDAYSVEDDD